MTYHAVCRSHRFFFTSDQRNWQNARAFDEFRSHLVTVGRIDQMRSAFGQTRSAIGQMRTHLTLRSHLVTVGRIDQMRSAFGQMRSAIGQTRARFTKRCAFGQMPRAWPIGQMCCAFAQMRCTFGQSYQQWPNANAVRQMREHFANCTDLK